MLECVYILDPPDHAVDDLRRAFDSLLPDQCELALFTDSTALIDRLRKDHRLSLVVVHAERGDGMRPGEEIISSLRGLAPDLPIVAVADHGDVRSAADVIAAGANDFLVRGDQLEARASTLLAKMQGLLEAIERARTLDERNSQLEETIQARFHIVGESPQIQELLNQVKQVARVPRPVLILGERGTGKELVARAIHFAAQGPSQPIVTVNCAAFSNALLESELFGHERGAFTGADETRHGKFEQANGGTLFLDEISHMSRPFQQKILRVVEYGTFTRVGGHREQKASVRIIGATNVDLKAKIKGGEFLSDLYDRLSFEVIRVPALRDRVGDVEVLARHFLNQFALEIPTFRGKSLARSAVEGLHNYSFPGNVRELKNIIERAAYRDTTNEITPEDIGMLPEHRQAEGDGSFKQRVDTFCRELIADAMQKSDGNQAQAARLLGLTYHQFRHYRSKYLRSDGQRN